MEGWRPTPRPPRSLRRPSGWPPPSTSSRAPKESSTQPSSSAARPALPLRPGLPVPGCARMRGASLMSTPTSSSSWPPPGWPSRPAPCSPTPSGSCSPWPTMASPAGGGPARHGQGRGGYTARCSGTLSAGGQPAVQRLPLGLQQGRFVSCRVATCGAGRHLRCSAQVWASVALPTSQHTNLPPLVEGPTVRLVGRHAKVRRAGYRTRAR
jgi:hypothetical protein